MLNPFTLHVSFHPMAGAEKSEGDIDNAPSLLTEKAMVENTTLSRGTGQTVKSVQKLPSGGCKRKNLGSRTCWAGTSGQNILRALLYVVIHVPGKLLNLVR